MIVELIRSSAKGGSRLRGARRHAKPLACVMGDTDLVWPLSGAGIQCAVVAFPNQYVRYSRYPRTLIPALDPLDHPQALGERMLDFARRQESRPALFYQSDRDLIFLSRHREWLGEGFRFVLPAPELVEDLVDKGRFTRLATELQLPVPRSVLLGLGGCRTPNDVALTFPLVVKPLTRDPKRWAPIGQSTKALLVPTRQRLLELWPRIGSSSAELMAQELIPGPETRIESYHAYVDESGEVVGEFTGEKIRTLPPQQGHSTALRITDQEEVASAGRDLLRRIGFRGIAKVDFKRAPDGTLWLLEINPRFSLWHNPGAVAGVNLPALVYADLAGLPRSPAGPVRQGVRWCEPIEDLRAARAAGVPLARWLPWALRCESKHAVAWHDPMPFLRAILLPYLGRRLRRVLSSARRLMPGRSNQAGFPPPA